MQKTQNVSLDLNEQAILVFSDSLPDSCDYSVLIRPMYEEVTITTEGSVSIRPEKTGATIHLHPDTTPKKNTLISMAVGILDRLDYQPECKVTVLAPKGTKVEENKKLQITVVDECQNV